MRLLILTEFFAPAWAFGGPPKTLFEIARELVKRGHSVTVYTTNVLNERDEILRNYDVLEGIKVYYLKTLSKWLAWNENIFLPIGLRKLLKENSNKYDLILMGSFRTFTNVLGYYYARKCRKPYVLLPYGSLPRGTCYKKIIKWIVDLFFGYDMLKNSSGIFAQTENEVRESIKYGANKTIITLVPLNLDLTEFTNLPPRGNFRRKFGIKNHEKVILFLGRLHQGKGLDLLINSFSHLIKKMNYNCRLIIIGRDDGYLSLMLENIKSQRLQRKVIFAGAIYGEKRLEAYVDADVFVMPSLFFEETSTAALEACATSTPVIVTKQASIPGLDKYQAGITINYSQIELVNALLELLDDDKLRWKMGINARKMVEEIFDLRKVVDIYEDMFNNLIG